MADDAKKEVPEELEDQDLNAIAGGEDSLKDKLLFKDGGDFWEEKGVDQVIGIVVDGMKDNGTGRPGFNGTSGRGTGRKF